MDTCIIESSLTAGNDTLQKEVGLNGTNDRASFTGLDGNVPMFLEKTELPTESSEFIAMPLYNNSVESDESLYISSGYVSFSALCYFVFIFFIFILCDYQVSDLLVRLNMNKSEIRHAFT